MGKVLIGVLIAVASFMLAESLICNKCRFSLGSFCLSNTEETCSTNTSVCFTGTVSFPSVSSSFGFNNQGCREPAGCNLTTNGSIIFVDYQTKVECCSTDKCNPVTLSGAPSVKMTFTATISAAMLATVFGSMM